jgi:glycosyltransferase involved in cell wall biosynthesis
MKKIVFFIEPEWAFGSIHYELTKQLFGYGINSFVLPWNTSYTKEEMAELCDNIDYFVTIPLGIDKLHDDYSIPYEKCIVVCHASIDLHQYIAIGEGVNKIHKFAVVSNWLVEQSKELNISRKPDLVEMGINFDTYYSSVSNELKVVGYAGSYNRGYESIKRAPLAEKVVFLSNLNFKVAQFYHNSFITMAGFYKTVDAVLISSTEEGAGLPSLEAGAAGKLVISTPVGVWNSKIKDIGGVAVPIDEAEFIVSTIQTLNYYKSMPKEYRNRCLQIQEHAKSYDWKYVIGDWVNLLSN